jgi:hypothetical protein
MKKTYDETIEKVAEFIARNEAERMVHVWDPPVVEEIMAEMFRDGNRGYIEYSKDQLMERLSDELRELKEDAEDDPSGEINSKLEEGLDLSIELIDIDDKKLALLLTSSKEVERDIAKRYKVNKERASKR